MYQLVVKHPFASFNIGDRITAKDEVAKWGASHANHVTRLAATEALDAVASETPEAPPRAAFGVIESV